MILNTFFKAFALERKNKKCTTSFFNTLVGKQAQRIMKLTAIIMLSTFLSVSARGYSQQITLSGKNMPMEEILKQIQNQSAYRFIYTVDVIQKAIPVNISVKNVPLAQALSLCFKDQPLIYSIVENVIVIKTKGVEKKAGETLNLPLPPPPITITGRVTNAKGEPLPMASILIKGTKKGFITDFDGNYKLQVDADVKILVFSHIGMKKQEVVIASRTTINVVLVDEIAALKEVTINAGYYTTTDRLKTGNITKVTGADINKSPVSNPLAALQGRVAGMNITQSSGVPGSAFKVEIRGRTQFDKTQGVSAGNDPLYIIDGVPIASGDNNINRLGSAITAASTSGLSPLFSMNMADIESIEVLKDADATSIYGSRGANGVILITTKRGKAGTPKFDFNISTGTSVAPLPHLMNTKQYVAMRKEAFKNDNIAMTTTNAYDLLVWDTLRDNNLAKQLIGGTARTINAQATLSGGTELTQYVLGGGYYRETSVYPGNMPNSRASARFNITTRSADQKFMGTFSGSYSSSLNTAPNTDLAMSTILPPNYKLYEADGSLAWNEGGIQTNNPLAYLLKKYSVTTNNINGNMNLSYNILRNLKVKSSLGYNIIGTDELENIPISSINPLASDAQKIGQSYFGRSRFTSWIWEPQIEYNKKLGKGNLSALAGATMQSQRNEGYNFTVTGYSTDDVLGSLNGISTIQSASSNAINYKYQAFYGRVNYNYDNKYILNLSGRRDGSSRFGPDFRFSNFGAIGAAWVFGSENFMKQFSFISFAKLRASYGITGNDKIGDYSYLDLYQSYVFYATYDRNIAYTPKSLFRPDLHWEKNTKSEIALDLRFLEDRFQVSASWYRNVTSDPLVSYPLPATTGFLTVTDNLKGILIGNTGLELVISSQNIKSKDFIWVTDFNISFPSNKLLKFPNIDQSAYANKYIVGKSISTVYTGHFIGVDPQTGLGTVQDYNNNGKFDGSNYPNGDLYPTFNTDPKYFGGLQNSITYKRLRLDFLLQFTKQIGRSWANTPYSYNTPFGYMQNALTLASARWQKPGDITSIPKFSTSGSISTSLSSSWATTFSDRGYCDASYVRLKNISLTYDLPTTWVKKAGMQSLRVYMQAQNLFTFSPYKGVDPETTFMSFLAPLRTLIMGIQFGL